MPHEPIGFFWGADINCLIEKGFTIDVWNIYQPDKNCVNLRVYLTRALVHSDKPYTPSLCCAGDLQAGVLRDGHVAR